MAWREWRIWTWPQTPTLRQELSDLRHLVIEEVSALHAAVANEVRRGTDQALKTQSDQAHRLEARLDRLEAQLTRLHDRFEALGDLGKDMRYRFRHLVAALRIHWPGCPDAPQQPARARRPR